MRAMTAGDHHPTAFVRTLTRLLDADRRVEFAWLEGSDDSIQWPPYQQLDLHLAAAEPDLEPLRRDLAQLLGQADTIADFSQQEAPLKGFAGTAVLSDGTNLSYRVERTSQIAKVPRKAVNVLLDRSGGLLLPALDFE